MGWTIRVTGWLTIFGALDRPHHHYYRRRQRRLNHLRVGHFRATPRDADCSPAVMRGMRDRDFTLRGHTIIRVVDLVVDESKLRQGHERSAEEW